MRIALAGNPNCGKTTLFNALTGLHYKVANYPGVTVEKKEGRFNLVENEEVTLLDLPGIYSLSGSSLDERIATKVLLGTIEKGSCPDLLVAVVDASNLERNLYLVTQLIDMGLPLVIALNMVDIAERRGLRIYKELLSRLLDVPVVPIIANKGEGFAELKSALSQLSKIPKQSNRQFTWLNVAPAFRASSLSLGKRYLELENSVLRSDEGMMLLLGSSLLSESLTPTNPQLRLELLNERQKLRETGIDPFTFEATNRYKFINSVVTKACVKEHAEKRGVPEFLDSLTTHRIWGTLIFVLLMSFIFQSIFLWAELPMNFIESAFLTLGEFVRKLLPAGQLNSLLVDGVIAGVGSVVMFVPQIAILFLFLGLLEDTGYLARAAFLMDRIMRPFGLQGRSFIPLLSSFACAIPGILSSRTIPSWADRLATIMIAPLMSCSARLPVYAVLIAAFIPEHYVLGVFSLKGLTLLGMYLLGIVGALLVSWALKVTILKHEPAMFVMEMPSFKTPSIKGVIREVYDRVKAFIVNAGTTILACSIILWFLASYPRLPEDYVGSRIEASYAGQIGHAMEPIIKPLGFNWEIGVGLLASFAAREVFVSSLATVYNIEDDSESSKSLVQHLRAQKADGSFTTLSALSLLVFYVFACQCMSTLAVCRRETGSWSWTAFMFIYMTALAYISSLVTFQLGTAYWGV